MLRADRDSVIRELGTLRAQVRLLEELAGRPLETIIASYQIVRRRHDSP